MRVILGLATSALACFVLGGRDLVDAMGTETSPREGIATIVVGVVLAAVASFLWRGHLRRDAR
jgi:citrate lyase beta subunit